MVRAWLTAVLVSLAATAAVAGEAQFVTVDDPYIELHTGPGKGYPITRIIERGARIEIVKRRTQWFKVRDERGEQGWAAQEQMARTLQPSGKPAEFREPGREDYQQQRWSIGLLAGDFGGATVYTGFAAYRLSKHLAVELDASQILGNFSDGWGASINISHTFVPEWRASPFFSLGTGIIRIEPKSTLAQAEDRTDQTAIVGAGVQAYLSRRFVVRAEYKSYVVLSSRNDNEDVDEWKAGFAVFF